MQEMLHLQKNTTRARFPVFFSNKRYDKIEFCTVTGGGPCLKYCEISLLERERTKEE